MEIETVKTAVADLQAGMYVSSLDRPWLETPFPFQGFIVTEADIREIAKYSEYVYVDVARSRHFFPRPAALSPHPSVTTTARPLNPGTVHHYPRTTTRQQELKTASTLHLELNEAYKELLGDIHNNHKLNIPRLRQAITPMVDSVIRNPDAFLLLTRLKRIDAYAYQHAMSCAVLAVATGRQIGLPKPMLEELALGAALFDIGRVKLPDELLTQSRHLSVEEMALVRKHVQFSLEALSHAGSVSDEVVEMIATHHERHDGSGYPEGLAGEAIPLFGRIAGLVDCYDAITSSRPYAVEVSPDRAISLLYEWRDRDFQGALIEQFIHVVGVYPVGTIVELNDGRIGIVVVQHPEARLKPTVMVVLEGAQRAVTDFYEVDLKAHPHGDDGEPLSILHGLPSGSHGINPADYFIQMEQ